jgi:Zn-dependent protease
LFGSFPIGRLFGITVRLHWLFVVLVVFMIAFGPLTLAGNALLLGALSLIVFLHELGHSLAARLYGIEVLDITLWPLGGMARFSEIPEDSKIEAVVAAAGPAVNLLLALLALPLLGGEFSRVFLAGPDPTASVLEQCARAFIAINLTLGIFNLIPAFPMDGGRILRALLARRGDWLRATEQAVSIGRFFAVGMVVLGLLAPFHDVGFLALMGFFLWFSGSRELWAVRLRHGGSFFARAMGLGAAPRPAPSVARSAPAAAPDGWSGEWTGARRPEPGPSTPQQGNGGWTQAEIERLERYRGRIRQVPD